MIKRTRFTPNIIIMDGDICRIYIYNIKCEKVAEAIIDSKHYSLVRPYKWHIGMGYVLAYDNGEHIRLHRLIMKPKRGYDIDHINHDKLDNRETNLRCVNRSKNSMNRAGVRGYSWNSSMNKWEVKICAGGKKYHLGYYELEKDAIKARKKGEKKYYKEFAYNN